MNKKFLAWLLTAALVLTGAGGALCESAEKTAIDFEDGVFGFIGLDMSAGNADASSLSVVDYNGSKALMVDIQKKVPYLAFELDGLLHEGIEKVRSITMDVGLGLCGGTFYACSGRVYAYSGAELTKSYDEWSVYMAGKNPKTITATLAEGETFTAGAGNYIVLSKEVDNFVTRTGGKPVTMYVDNIRFLDADGKALPVDPSAVYVARSSGPDWSNLTVVDHESELGGAGSGGAWSQGADILTVAGGGAFDPATLRAGDIITIYFEGAGRMWLVGVSSGNKNGDWIRVADGGNAPVNGSNNMAQVTYEQLVAALGADFASTLQKLQCESDQAWAVTKVTVGRKADALYGLAGAVDLNASGSAGAWAQGADIVTVAGGGTFDPSAIVPGTVFNISFSGAGNMWLVFVSSGNKNGDWVRVADGGNSLQYNGNAQVTYDQIVAALGADFASTLQKIQCESDQDWEVYGVTFGKAVAPYAEAKDQVELGGAGKGEAWSQAADIYTVAGGGTFDPALIVKGSVLTVNYAGEGNMWLVFVSSGNKNGDWVRVADGGMASKNAAGDKVQITYDQIVAALGADFAATLQRIQCESDQAWESYSVTLGVAAE